MLIAVILLGIYFLAVARPAQAYIDPGTGGMLVQIVVGAVLGVSLAGRKYFTALARKLFGKKESVKKEDEPQK